MLRPALPAMTAPMLLLLSHGFSGKPFRASLLAGFLIFGGLALFNPRRVAWRRRKYERRNTGFSGTST